MVGSLRSPTPTSNNNYNVVCLLGQRTRISDCVSVTVRGSVFMCAVLVHILLYLQQYLYRQ